MKRIYLDHAATTPLCEEAKAAMRPWLGRRTGNPSSLHEEGRRARQAVDRAREQAAASLGCLFGEIVFTSGGTESAATALVGAALAAPADRRRILVGAADHHCVLHLAPFLERLGMTVEAVPVQPDGSLDLNRLEEMLGPDAALASLLHGNNETGALTDVKTAASLARRHGVLVHVDAVQTFPGARLEDLDCDMASFSSHKGGGPQGAGALFLRSGVKIKPLLPGGGQEREMRGGTENTAALAGYGAACEAWLSHPEWPEARRASRDAFVKALSQLSPEGLAWTLPRRGGLPGHAHFRLAGIQADTMLIRLDRLGVSASAGAACSSGSLEPSHVLLACGLNEVEAGEGLRFTFGWTSTIEEAEAAARAVADAAQAVRRAQARGHG